MYLERHRSKDFKCGYYTRAEKTKESVSHLSFEDKDIKEANFEILVSASKSWEDLR